MSNQAFKRVRRSLGLEVCRKPLPKYTSVGCYPLLYVFTDGGCLCADCVNGNIDEIDSANRGSVARNSHGGWAVDAVDVNYEDDSLFCDHCGERIESAYGSAE
jgi:hypothetical protein